MDLVDEWHAARVRWDAAHQKPVAVRNALFDEQRNLGQQIAARPDLHRKLEGLCSPEHGVSLRLGAALVREHWDLDGTIQVLTEILEASGREVARPMTMTEALTFGLGTPIGDAALCLYNIDEGRGNTGSTDPS